MEALQETGGEWLQRLAESQRNEEQDDTMMTNLLRRIGYKSALCTCGVVYLKGEGTLDAPPVSIHQLAGKLLEVAGGKK